MLSKKYMTLEIQLGQKVLKPRQVLGYYLLCKPRNLLLSQFYNWLLSFTVCIPNINTVLMTSGVSLSAVKPF